MFHCGDLVEELTIVVIISRRLGLETLSSTCLLNDLARHSSGVKNGASRKNLPVIEHHLWEGLTAGGGT